MEVAKDKKIPWPLWPFWVIWKLISGIVAITGRVLAVVLGLVLMVIGTILTVTIVGAVVGLPFIVIGFLLVLRGIF